MDLTLPIDIRSPQGDLVGTIEMGAAEGKQYVTLNLHNGDVIGLRNIQGGSIDTGQPDDINLDIGAGNSVQRGWVSVNPDVGKGMIVGSGRSRHLAKFAGHDDPLSDLIDLYARVRLHKGLFIPNGSGGWRRAL